MSVCVCVSVCVCLCVCVSVCLASQIRLAYMTMHGVQKCHLASVLKRDGSVITWGDRYSGGDNPEAWGGNPESL